MRGIIGNTYLMVTTAIAIGAAGFVFGYVLRDFTWFARSGALIVAVGLVLLSRASVIGQDLGVHVKMADTGLSSLDPEHYRRVEEPIPEFVVEDRKTRNAVGVWGPIVSCVGTIIWGFGDLLR